MPGGLVSCDGADLLLFTTTLNTTRTGVLERHLAATVRMASVGLLPPWQLSSPE